MFEVFLQLASVDERNRAALRVPLATAFGLLVRVVVHLLVLLVLLLVVRVVVHLLGAVVVVVVLLLLLLLLLHVAILSYWGARTARRRRLP